MSLLFSSGFGARAASPRAWLPALLAHAVALAACGSGSDSPGALPPNGECAAAVAEHGAAFACRVVSFTPGEGAGFGQDLMPGVVLGPPRGGGEHAGSTDVVSLGAGGEIVLEMGSDIVDAEGPDLIVFENAFFVKYAEGVRFAEPGSVAFSADGETFVEVPCDPTTFAGCAGIEPVYATPENGIDPTDPDAAGGDAFDLAATGLPSAKFVRIRDVSQKLSASTSGFDLDALARVHTEP